LQLNKNLDNIRKKEIRVAVVFYGGVTLAIYENGVAQSFFDLTHKQHVFKLVLEMLDADAIIDVLSGASAGGINSLLLSCALEHGTNIKATNKLWRELADFGELIYKPTEERPDSLLDKDNAFLNRLIIGFKNLADKKNKPTNGFEPIKNEIDLFITGTDLHGRIYTYIDQIGSIIDDKDHRTVFHLKYRPGNDPSDPRKRVGVTTKFLEKNKEEKNPENLIETQATTLASIARITASFPGAFPPYSIDKIENKKVVKEVKDALSYFADIKQSEVKDGNRMYVDGGTLNNKPFEPVLKSIFYRMPDSFVERKLFYVEPNPALPSKESLYGTQKAESPLNVLLSTGSSIPLHQSIRDNLEYLKEHNAKVEWLSKFRESAKSSLNNKKVMIGNDVGKIYLNTRVESTAKSILLRTVNPPKAEDRVMVLGEENGMSKSGLKIENYLLDFFQIIIKEKLISKIDDTTDTHLHQHIQFDKNEISNFKMNKEKQFDSIVGEKIKAEVEDNVESEQHKSVQEMINDFNKFDVNYLQRKCFYILYEVYNEIYRENTNNRTKNTNKDYSEEEIIRLKEILSITGRLIKLVKIIRVSLVKLRDQIIKDAVEKLNNKSELDMQYVQYIVEIFIDFVRVPGIDYWHDIKLWNTETLRSLNEVVDLEEGVFKKDYEWEKIYEKLSKGLSSENFNELNTGISQEINKSKLSNILDNKKTNAAYLENETSIISIIDKVLDNLVLGMHSPLKYKCYFENFTYIDSLLFPQEYLSGIFEKDKVEYVRISPRDAKIGLSDLPLSSKIAGDDLGSFGGFMRRDWRSNDILWGRLDSICLIIQTLLPDKKISDILNDNSLVNNLDSYFTDAKSLNSFFPNLPDDDKQIQNVIATWQALRNSQDSISIEAFRNNLILAAQNNIVAEDLHEIYEDMYYQEIKWDLIKGQKNQNENKLSVNPQYNNNVQPGASEKVIESQARIMADKSLQELPVSERGEHFKRMKIGEESVTGDNSALPMNITAEYLTNTWLVLLNMVKVSFDKEGQKKTVLDSKTFKWIAKHPVLYLHLLLKMSREERPLSLILTTVLTTAAIIAIVYAMFHQPLILGEPKTWLWYLIPIGVLYVLYKFHLIRLFGDKGLWGTLMGFFTGKKE